MKQNMLISPQYLQPRRIEVTINKIVSPSHFILRETPGQKMSREANQFLDLERKLMNYYDSVKFIHSAVPEKGTVVVVLLDRENKWCRARVDSILESTSGLWFRVYLLDYGELISVRREGLRNISPQFLTVPFQAIDFVLLGLKPKSMIIDLVGSVSFGQVSEWDSSAFKYVTDLWKRMLKAEIQIQGYDDDGKLYGVLYIQDYHSFLDLNHVLTENNYACVSDDSYEGVHRIENYGNFGSSSNDNEHNQRDGIWHDRSHNSMKSGTAKTEVKKERLAEITAMRKSLQLKMQNYESYPHNRTSAPQTPKQHHSKRFDRFMRALSSASQNSSAHLTQKSLANHNVSNSDSTACPVTLDLQHPSLINTGMLTSHFVAPTVSVERISVACNISSFSPDEKKSKEEESSCSNSSCSLPPFSEDEDDAISGDISPCSFSTHVESLSKHPLLSGNSVPAHTSNSKSYDENNMINTQRTCQITATQNQNEKSLNLRLEPFDEVERFLEHSACSNINNSVMIDHCIEEKSNGINSIICKDFDRNQKPSLVIAKESIDSRNTSVKSEISNQYSLPVSSASCSVHMGKADSQGLNQLIKSFRTRNVTRKKQHNEANGENCTQLSISFTDQDSSSSSSSKPTNMAFEVENNGQYFCKANCARQQNIENPPSPVSNLYSPEITSSVLVETNRIHSRCNQTAVTSSRQHACAPSSRKIFEKVRNMCQSDIISRNGSCVGSSPSPSFRGGYATSDSKDHLDDLAASSVMAVATDNQIIKAVNSSASLKQLEETSSEIEMQPLKFSSTKPTNMGLENNGQYFYKSHCTRQLSVENPSSSINDLYSFEATSFVSAETDHVHSKCNQTVETPSNQRPCTPSSRKMFEKVRNLCQSHLVSRNSSQAGCSPSPSFTGKHATSDIKDHVDDLPVVALSTNDQIVKAVNSNTNPKQHEEKSSEIEMQPLKFVNILKSEVFPTDDPKKNLVTNNFSIIKPLPENHGETLENNTSSKEPVVKSQQNCANKNVNKAIQPTSNKNAHSGGKSTNSGNTFKSQPMVQCLDYLEFNLNPNLTDLCFQTNVDFSGRMLWEDVELPVIKLGECIPKPMLHTDEVPFALSIRQRLKTLNFWGPSCIQSVVWPVVFRNRCFVAIAPAGSGKTIAYLLPILSNLFDGSKYRELRDSNGPILLVLCSTWMKVRIIYNQCQLLLGDYKEIKIVTLYKGGGEENKMVQLMNGCDILISTPASFVHYLEKKATNFERCCHMILDDGDVLIANFKNEVISLMTQFQAYIGIHQHHATFQIALCAQKWTKGVASFAETFLPNPLLYFTNFLEAAVCAQVPTYVLMTENAKKDAALLSLMEGMKCQKLVVCTSNEQNALQAHRALQRNAMSAQVAHEKMRNYEITAVRRHWESSHAPSYTYVLVVSDNVLHALKIKDADCIIHYDLPATSRLQFGHRLGCFSSHFSAKDTSRLKECLNHIIITENCQMQSPTFAKLLKRMGLDVPRPLLEMAAAQEQAKRNPAGASLCPYLKTFGTCNEKHCLNRHMVTKDSDHPTIIPFQGDVKVQICHVMNAARYYGKVLEYLDPITGSTVSLYDQYLKTCQAVKDYFQIKENRVKATSIIKSNVYAVEETGLIFHRARVIEVLPRLDDCRQQLVKVLHLDGGWVKVYSEEKLYELTPELKSFPQTAAEIQLCNIKTLDMCNHWTPQANMLVCNQIENKVIHGKIALCLGETLWLNPVVIRETLSNNTFVNTMVLDKTLKEAGYAQDNPDHLISLFKMCAGKVAKPIIIETKSKDPPPETAHAFLDLGVEQYVQVINVESPQRFFVQQSKFTSCLNTLLKDIAAMKKNFELKHVQKPQKDLYCIAPFPEDERLYRARIVDFKENEKREVEIQLFYLDFGDTAKMLMSKIYAMPAKLLLLPFQSIECQLAGVAPLHGGWSEQAIDAFQDFTRDEDNHMKYLRIMPYLKSPCYSGGHHYVVQLYDDSQSLSEHIVVKGLALATDMPALPQVPEVTIAANEEDVPSGYVTASDDEMLPEEKDAAAMMCGILAGLLTPHENLKKKLVSLEPNSLSKNAAICHPQGMTNAGTKILPSFVDLQPSKSLKPQITWWDTLDQVVVSLKLFDVEVYSLDCFPKGFLFSTKLGDKMYCAEETLFDEVIREETKVNCLGQSVELFFKKKERAGWPRLISSNQKVFHIKRDLEHIDDDSDNEPFHPPLIRDPMCKQDIQYECSSDDCKSSEDDGDDYQSWQNICRPKYLR